MKRSMHGLRPELDGMCRRYVEAGYVTFLPDLSYRLGSMSFAVPATAHEPLDPAMIAANGVTTVEMTIADTGVLRRERWLPRRRCAGLDQ